MASNVQYDRNSTEGVEYMYKQGDTGVGTIQHASHLNGKRLHQESMSDDHADYVPRAKLTKDDEITALCSNGKHKAKHVTLCGQPGFLEDENLMDSNASKLYHDDGDDIEDDTLVISDLSNNEPMLESCKKSLYAIRPQLEKSILVVNILSQLHEHAGGFLNDHEEEQVNDANSVEKMRLLLKILKAKTNKDFVKFCKVLESSGYGHYATKLKGEAGIKCEALKEKKPQETNKMLSDKRGAFSLSCLEDTIKNLQPLRTRVFTEFRNHMIKLKPKSPLCNEVRSMCQTKIASKAGRSSFDPIPDDASQLADYIIHEHTTAFDIELIHDVANLLSQPVLLDVVVTYETHLKPLMTHSVAELTDRCEEKRINQDSPKGTYKLVLKYPQDVNVQALYKAKGYLEKILDIPEAKLLAFDNGCILVFFEIVSSADPPLQLAKRLAKHTDHLKTMGISGVFLIDHWAWTSDDNIWYNCDNEEVNYESDAMVVNVEHASNWDEKRCHQQPLPYECVTTDVVPFKLKSTEYSKEKASQRDDHLFQDFHAKLMKAAIEEGGSVSVEIIKCVTLGPPEAGKTQLKKALTGDFEASSESTPLSSGAEIVLEYFVEGELTWNRFDREQLQSALHTTIAEQDYQARPKHLHTSQKCTEEAIPISKGKSFHGNTAGLTLQDMKQVREPVIHTSSLAPLVPMQEDSPVGLAFSKVRERVLRNLSHTTSHKPLNNIRLIHFIDSGGQPAFFDLHPMLATSRSLYFLLFNSREGLLDYPQMTFRKPSQFPTKSILNTTQTNLDLIKRSLYILHHCKEKFLRMEEKLKNRLSDDITFESDDVLPVIVVGSRKSQQSQDEKEASELLKFSCCHIPMWQDTQPYVTMVESLDPSCTSIMKLRQAVSKAESKFKIRLPLLWLQCQLIFWSTDDPTLSVVTYQDLKHLCTEGQLVSSDDEFLAMLSTFHMLGIFSCPTIDYITVDPDGGDSLHQSPVFTKPDVLYQQVSRILEIPFQAFNIPGQNLTITERKNLDKLQRSGVLTAESLSILGVPDTLGSFSSFQSFLLKSLVRWGLAAEVSQDPDQLFIPSILPPCKDHVPTTSQGPIPSLALAIATEDPRDYYVPQGIFPHFVVSIMHRCSDGYGLDVGVGDATPRCRDAITLRKIPCKHTEFPYYIPVVDRIDHISVHITPALDQKGKDSNYQWSPLDCHIIIEDLKHSMEEAYYRLYQKNRLCSVLLCSQCTICPLSGKKEHLAHLNPEDLTIYCLSRECEEMYSEKCDGVLEVILKGPKLIQRKGFPSSIIESQGIASEFNCEQFMDKYKERFLEVVAAKKIARKLIIDSIIPSALLYDIKQTDPYEASEQLYRHLCQHGTPSTIHTLCDIMANEKGYPNMNSLGKDMKEDIIEGSKATMTTGDMPQPPST